MTDYLTLAVLGACALSCSLAVLLGEHLYRCLTKQTHGHRPDRHRSVFADRPRLSDDFKTVFHEQGDTL